MIPYISLRVCSSVNTVSSFATCYKVLISLGYPALPALLAIWHAVRVICYTGTRTAGNLILVNLIKLNIPTAI